MPIQVLRLFELSNLQNRPRVSHRVSEYVVDYVASHVLQPLKTMQSDTITYQLTFNFTIFDPATQKYFSNSPYNNSETNYLTTRGFRTHDKNIKWSVLSITSSHIGNTITPVEYAGLVYDAFADFLITNFKKVSREKMDALKAGLDSAVINSFAFPAPFEEQKYISDDSKYSKTFPELVWTTAREEYLKHFDF